jgi:hypothetical protein
MTTCKITNMTTKKLMKYTRTSQLAWTSDANPSYIQSESVGHAVQYKLATNHYFLSLTIMMYQLLTTMSTNRVAANQIKLLMKVMQG